MLVRHQVPHLNAELSEIREELEDAQSRLRNTRAAVDAADEQRRCSDEEQLRTATELRRTQQSVAEVGRLGG